MQQTLQCNLILHTTLICRQGKLLAWRYNSPWLVCVGLAGNKVHRRATVSAEETGETEEMAPKFQGFWMEENGGGSAVGAGIPEVEL